MISNFGLFPPLSSFFIGTTIQCECLDWIELAVLLFLIKFRSLQILKNFPFLAANITGINCVQIIMWVPHTYYHLHFIKGKFARHLKDFFSPAAGKCSFLLIDKRFNLFCHKTHPLVLMVPIKVVSGLYLNYFYKWQPCN